MRVHVGICALAMLVLAGCGTSPTDRAVSGAGIGAGTGAVAGALLGFPVIGALVGAGVGATAGAATSPSDVNLGKPVWK